MQLLLHFKSAVACHSAKVHTFTHKLELSNVIQLLRSVVSDVERAGECGPITNAAQVNMTFRNDSCPEVRIPKQAMDARAVLPKERVGSEMRQLCVKLWHISKQRPHALTIR